ncbi:hypothetical protein CLF_103657 [Clonorchis sinensis]|uniref:Uncharacterized protein n=1 Tax=Clonorchis sinensis TaxID=79923 RepID=H2KQC6_CLOSI|nr:hypothetical protein CLF_103657 [Clonorchis sinensis]
MAQRCATFAVSCSLYLAWFPRQDIDGRHIDSKLMRTKSLDGRTVSSVADRNRQGVDDSSQQISKSNEEFVRLRKEVVTLREELYMKLGELATIKESAKRANATKSDAIIRLESSLKSEREEFQHRLNELTTQLAFREADYRLVTSELARVKEQVATARTSTFQEVNGCQNAPEFSPASQIIASVAMSPYTDRQQPSLLQSPSQSHLPAPVTPVPSRRRTRHVDGMWRVPIASKAEAPLSPTAIPSKLRNGYHANSDVVLSAVEPSELLEYGDLETPRKRPRHCGLDPLIAETACSPRCQLVDVAVGTDIPSTGNQFAGKLRYRIPRITHKPGSSRVVLQRLSTGIPTPNKLASDLLRLVVLEEADCQDQSYSTMEAAISSLSGSSLLSTDHYLQGIRILVDCKAESITPSSSPSKLRYRALKAASFIKSLTDALPHLVVRIEELLKLVLMFPRPLQSDSHGIPAPSSTNVGKVERPSNVFGASISEQEDGTEGISYLGEDPFAGAPASQIVAPLPPLPFRRTHSVELQGRPKQHQNDVASSAPATVRQTHSSTDIKLVPLSKFGDWPSSPHQAVLQRGLSALKQVQCILKTLHQWQATLRNSPGDADHSVALFQLHSHIGRLMSQFINQLADIRVSQLVKTSPKQSSLGSSTHRTFILLPLTTTQTQFGSDSSRSGLGPPSQLIGPCRLPSAFSNIFSHLVLNIADSLASLVISMSDVQTKKNVDFIPDNSQNLDWSLSFVDCILLATGVQDECVVDEQSELDTLSSTTSLTSLILFIRLARSMVSAGLWSLGHQTGVWWQNVAHSRLSSEKKLELSGGRNEAMLRLFGATVGCCLRSLVGWVRNTADRFESVITNLSDPSDDLLSTDSMPDDSRQHRLVDWDLKLMQLLGEFSGFIVALVEQPDIEWPENCPCKHEVYSTLIHLSKVPLQRLLTLPAMTFTLDSVHLNESGESRVFHELQCVLSAFGQFTRSLTALLWRHGDTHFQAHTDSLPSYFFVISALSRWLQQYKIFGPDRCANALSSALPANPCEFVIRPELVDELHDFESSVDNGDHQS